MEKTNKNRLSNTVPSFELWLAFLAFLGCVLYACWNGTVLA
jgi:hypothetical protein